MPRAGNRVLVVGGVVSGQLGAGRSAAPSQMIAFVVVVDSGGAQAVGARSAGAIAVAVILLALAPLAAPSQMIAFVVVVVAELKPLGLVPLVPSPWLLFCWRSLR
jgi:hypothetical protein